MGYVIDNVRIFDGSGRAPFPGSVRIDGDRIAEVVASPAAPAANGHARIDGGGATLMPGLIESHAHLGFTYNLSQAQGQWGVTPERARGFERELEVTVEAVARMRKRGIRVLPGGDYGFPFTPHGTYARDLWLFVKVLGFSPVDRLVAATRLGGEIMGRPGELGVVAPGALADLLLIDGDPSADIEILQDRSAIRMIMKGGALHKAPPRAAGGAAA